MFDDFNLIIADFSVLLGEVYCFVKQIFCDRWVKVSYVKLDELGPLLVGYCFEPFYYCVRVSPLVKLERFRYIIYYLF